MIKNFWIVLTLFGVLSSPLLAQDAPPDSQVITTGQQPNIVKDFFHDQGSIWTSPYKIKRADLKWLVPVGLGTAALLSTDHRISNSLLPDTGLRSPSRVVSKVGDFTPVVASLSFWTLGRVTHNEHAAETGRLGSEALLDTEVVVQGLKLLTQRQRPDMSNHQSFPSGHTAGAFTFASVLAHEYHDKPMVAIGAYSFATAVGLARIGGENHFPSDVLAGAVIGELIGRYVVHKHAN